MRGTQVIQSSTYTANYSTNYVRNSNYLLLILVSLLFFSSNIASSQSKQALRYEIDAKRGGITYTSKDALPRGREFKRLDSTYYVGWMLEGTYKFDHAADYIGFQAAATQLQRAMDLMVKDFKPELKTRTNDVMTYLKIMKLHRDWDYMAYALMQCYSNTDQPDLVWKLLQRCKQIDLQDELYCDTYNYLAWTVHRNRFHTSSKYKFLKSTIDENEKYANVLLDSSALKIKRDAALNTFFGANYEKEKMPSVWHYKSILYTYQFNIESGAYYYDKLKSTEYFPTNNYATFCSIQANFKEAEEFYTISKNENTGDKRLNESVYYLSILNEYKNGNKTGIDELHDVIKANGSTPGFGWYSLALARNLTYDGQIDIAKRYALRAEQFKEIHIGTTLGQSHYDFTVSLLNLILKNKEIAALKFTNNDWWYSPSVLSKLAQLTVEKYGLQFLIINQFSQNPERERVIYKLFSTESTVSFDEIAQLLDGFSTNYFLDRFKKEINTDKRYNVKRYYKYFVARLLIKKGNYDEALSYLQSILNEMLLDQESEKLLLARVYESICICKEHEEGDNSYDVEMGQLFAFYPQLIPYSGLSPKMILHTNASTTEQHKIIDVLKQSQIKWTNQSSKNIPEVTISFIQKEGIPIVQYYTNLNGKVIIPPQSITIKRNEPIGRNLSYAIFGIGNDDTRIERKDGNISKTN